MSEIRNLSDKELAQAAKEIALETKARASRKAATKSIQAVLRKHNLSVHDLPNLNFGTIAKGQSPKTTKKKAKGKSASSDKRSQVAVKYRNPEGIERWSGRGRTPGWVRDLLTKRKITIKQFKSDKRYKI